jgi:ATP-dependent DNA ligase
LRNLEADGPDVFHHACMLGLEGIVSKRKDSRYRSGRSPHWIKSKNPNAPAVKRPRRIGASTDDECRRSLHVDKKPRRNAAGA